MGNNISYAELEANRMTDFPQWMISIYPQLNGALQVAFVQRTELIQTLSFIALKMQTKNFAIIANVELDDDTSLDIGIPDASGVCCTGYLYLMDKKTIIKFEISGQ